jgi:FtsH-binding integral membrane protein
MVGTKGGAVYGLPSEQTSHADMEKIPTVVEGMSISLAEESVRRGFIRKVYGILSVQMLVTVVIAAPIAMMEPTELANHTWLPMTAMWTSLVLNMILACCCPSLGRRVPWNYLFLFAITVCLAIVVGFVSACYTAGSVLVAASLTVFLFAGLTAFACFTKSDFTGMGPYLFAALLGLCLTGFILSFVGGTFAHKLYAGIGAVLFSFYVIYDTQMIVKGKHQSERQFQLDDYVFAALTIYMDIINLFLMLLRLMGERRE